MGSSDRHEEARAARDVGSRSPASEEAKEQRHAGEQSGPRAAQSPGSGQQQPPQGSQRVSNRQPPEVRRHYAEGEAPSEQGAGGERSAEVIARQQQGIEPESGSHSAHGEHTEQAATSGEPEGEHTRHGRQHVPGDRSSQRRS